nr:integrase, catalytic region, zinc finger, CCHC-type, peptidase aspartic, catalytic [Tanacetum cinerariifolium]
MRQVSVERNSNGWEGLCNASLDIPQRIEEDYHSIKDDIPLVSVYTTRNVLVRGMPIPDVFLTKEIHAIDNFKEHETVFMNVVVPTNQPQPVVSDQGTHSSKNVAKVQEKLDEEEIEKMVEGDEDEESYASEFANSVLNDDVDNFEVIACTSDENSLNLWFMRYLSFQQPNSESFLFRIERCTCTQGFTVNLGCVRGCSKHMTGNLKLLINFVWKFMGTFCFGTDHVAAILGIIEIEFDIKNMTLNEYLEYEAEKERRL